MYCPSKAVSSTATSIRASITSFFIIKNDYESSSYLFDFINGLYDKMIEKNMCIIISGIKRVEDAARLFIKIRDEMKELIDSSLTFEFIGHLDLIISRITFAKKRKLEST